MRPNPVKARLQTGECVYGLFIDFYAPNIVEICGRLGFDFMIFDAEHGPLELTQCLEMVRAAELSNITPIIRVAQNVQQVILRYLDIGALGVHLPMVNTAEEARLAAQSVRYPPLGRRGLASVRAADYGLKPLAEYVNEANRELLLITHVENRQALNNLPEMLKVDGVDVFFLGPTDISSSLGHPGNPRHPEVMAAIEDAVRQIRAAGRVAGTLAIDPEWTRHWRERGVQYFCGGVTRVLVPALRKFLEEVRA